MDSYIDSLLKPNDLEYIFSRPKKNCIISLSELIELTKDKKRKDVFRKIQILLPKYRTYISWIHPSKEHVKHDNRQLNKMNMQYIKFFVEYNIKEKRNLPDTKAKKYGLMKKTDFGFCLNNTIRSADHVQEFYTYDKKNVIISSVYGNYETTTSEHFKYGFKLYHTALYRESCTTYVLVI